MVCAHDLDIKSQTVKLRPEYHNPTFMMKLVLPMVLKNLVVLQLVNILKHNAYKDDFLAFYIWQS